MTSTASAAAAAPRPQADLMAGIDIAQVLRSKGPVVKCVVLRAPNKDNNNDAAAATNGTGEDPLNAQWVEELDLDTTPKKNEVEKVLGGPFTFVGQYEEEGIMLMARRGWIYDQDEDEAEEEADKSDAHGNPHKLQPPFENLKIRGDILVLKVAEVDDPLDEPGADPDQPLAAVTNDEFFLNYSKEEYLTFAARTDVVPPVLPDESEEEEECEQEDSEEEEEEEGDAGEQWSENEDEDEEEMDEEEAQGAMLNLVLSTCLKKFREDNGRGPDTQELLVLKLAVAQKLGITLPGMEEEEGDDEEGENEETETPETEETEQDEEKADDESDKKRKPESDGDGDNQDNSSKKVKFENVVEEPPKEPEDGKPIAVH